MRLAPSNLYITDEFVEHNQNYQLPLLNSIKYQSQKNEQNNTNGEIIPHAQNRQMRSQTSWPVQSQETSIVSLAQTAPLDQTRFNTTITDHF